MFRSTEFYIFHNTKGLTQTLRIQTGFTIEQWHNTEAQKEGYCLLGGSSEDKTV
jgi:ABC-type xylose transport system substrate-binding protein